MMISNINQSMKGVEIFLQTYITNIFRKNLSNLIVKLKLSVIVPSNKNTSILKDLISVLKNHEKSPFFGLTPEILI